MRRTAAEVCHDATGLRAVAAVPWVHGAQHVQVTQALARVLSRLHLAVHHARILPLAVHVVHLGYVRTLLHNRERNVLFNNALNTFYLWLYGVRHMVKDHLIVRKETRCCHIGYSYRLTARVLLYASSHRQDNTYHSLYYTSRGALAGTRPKQQV